MNTAVTFRHVLDAVAFAARAHQGQLRKDKQTPYASHPLRVCLVVRDLFGFDDPRMLCAAILHDTVEDTTTDYDELAERFSPEVALWVAHLTKDKRLPEAEREAAYLRGLQAAPWPVKACKLADIYDNLVDMATLPADRHSQALQRIVHYLEGLSVAPPAELQRPLALTWELWRERSGL